MSYLNVIKNDQSLLALVESIDAQRKQERGEFTPTSSDPFSVDELNNTVDLDDQERGLSSDVSFDESSIELSDEDKAVVKKNLQAMLDEIQGDDISIPALEMVLQEVANQSAYLSESEEASVGSPVEKSELLKAKIKAIIGYSKELLELSADNDGVIPEEGGEVPATEEPSTDEPSSEEPDVVAEIGAEDEKKELEEASVSPEAEPVVEGTTEGEEEPIVEGEESLEEGVCTECGNEAIVEVDPSEVIKVVDEDEVEPIADEVEGGSEIDELKSKIDQLTSLVQSLAGNQQAVFEAAGLFGDYTNTNVEGKDPKINSGAQHSDFQKTATPKSTSGTELKLGELRTLASAPKKVAPSTQYGRENEAEAAKANSGVFKKDSRDQGKSTNTPESGYSKATSTNSPKKAPAQKTVSPEMKQATTSVLAESKRSFLEEARRIISGK